MATCKICYRRIGNREPRSYALIRRKSGGKSRKVYACESCQPAFDRWLDSRATDADGNPLEADSPLLLALQRLNWNYGRGTVIGYNLETGLAERRILWGQSMATAIIETRRFQFNGKTVFFLGHQQRIL